MALDVPRDVCAGHDTRVCGRNVDDEELERLFIRLLGGGAGYSPHYLARCFQPSRPHGPNSGDHGLVLLYLHPANYAYRTLHSTA